MQPTRTCYYSNAELARRALVKLKSISVALCRHGHFHGLRPLKLPNGRLVWPADQVDALFPQLIA